MYSGSWQVVRVAHPSPNAGERVGQPAKAVILSEHERTRVGVEESLPRRFAFVIVGASGDGDVLEET
jgi:hypothetical protein